MKNNYPGGIITPTSIIPLVFYARDNYPEFFPTTLDEDFCLLGFQRKLSSRRSGNVSRPHNSLLGRPTSASKLRIGNMVLASHHKLNVWRALTCWVGWSIDHRHILRDTGYALVDSTEGPSGNEPRASYPEGLRSSSRPAEHGGRARG